MSDTPGLEYDPSGYFAALIREQQDRILDELIFGTPRPPHTGQAFGL